MDSSLQLEAVYFSAPIPRDLAVLNVLGIVFDRVHFPGVYIPTSGFDRQELAKEIKRIEDLKYNHHNTALLLGMMHFTLLAPTLNGLCVFEENDSFFMDDKVPDRMAHDLYDAIHGPRPENWHPMIETTHHKGMPGNEVSLTYRGDYHYPCGALLKANETGFPLLNDMPGLPIPGLDGDASAPDANTLSAMIAIHSVLTVLPEIPLMHPSDLMEFRDDNKAALRGFRRAMLKYSADLKGKMKGLSADGVQEELTFFAKTTIVPALDELRETMERPSRAWHKRIVDAIRVAPQMAAAVMAAKHGDPVLAVLAAYAPQALNELVAKGDKEEALKRSGLYYLLKVQQAARR